VRALSRSAVLVLDFLRDLHAQPDVDALITQVVCALPRLIATDMASFNEVDPSSGKSRTVVSPAGADRFPGSEDIFERLVREHPYVVNVRRFEDGRAHRLSDFVGRADFRGLAIYNEYYRRIGTEHQVAVALPWTAPWVRGIALSRETRDYSDAERQLLATLAPHLVQAYRNAELLARAQRSTSAAGREGGVATPGDVEVVLLSATGRVQVATPRARRWLATYFGASTARDDRLPRLLEEWLCARRAPTDGADAVPASRQPLVVHRDGARLEVRPVAERGHRALLLRERGRALPAGDLAPLGLSAREAQVLAWVAEGKTNGEIGIILGAQPRTVAKHLERIFRKLGVETRTAAAAAALQLSAS
jgi:DNA-binding CsgD family transcriptional regulator